MRKAKLYDFSADYRDIAYFNFLPSYADPLLSRGFILNQQSFDIRRRFGSFHLDLLPGDWFTPYFCLRSRFGVGHAARLPSCSDGNEYPVPNRLRDLTNLYRGGVRFDLRRLHVTLEQGGTTFKDDQSLYQSGGVNPGYAARPCWVSAQPQPDHLWRRTVFAAPVSTPKRSSPPSARLAGSLRAISLQPAREHGELSAGRGRHVYLPAETPVLQQPAVSSFRRKPRCRIPPEVPERKSGPLHKVRILQSWLTDRLHNTGGSPRRVRPHHSVGSPRQIAAQLTSSLITNYNQVETDVIWDAVSRLTLRGGYRHVWGDASQASSRRRDWPPPMTAICGRDIVLGGFTSGRYRSSRLRERGRRVGQQSYFRTSLHDYQKARAQVRYQVMSALSVSGDFNLLSNQNPAPGVHYDYQARQQSLSLFWSPDAGKVFDIQGTYSRSTLRSDIGLISFHRTSPQQSLYRDNAHTASALMNFNLPHAGSGAETQAGGSFFVSSGTRASLTISRCELWIPTGKTLNWFAEWRYYGYGEALYLYESFRTHLLTAGVRITR